MRSDPTSASRQQKKRGQRANEVSEQRGSDAKQTSLEQDKRSGVEDDLDRIHFTFVCVSE